MMGYDGQTLTLSDTSFFDGSTTIAPSTTSTPEPTTGTGQEYGGGILGDTLYLKDIQLVGNVYKSDTNTYGSTGLKTYIVSSNDEEAEYWLASREYTYAVINDVNDFRFSGRIINGLGNLSSDVMSIYTSSSWSNNVGFNRNVRPILTLKSGLLIESGEGTKTSPYKLKVADSKTEEETKTTEESKEETKVNEDVAPKETVKNPKTGNNISYISGLIFVIISGLGLVLLKNKRLLNK